MASSSYKEEFPCELLNLFAVYREQKGITSTTTAQHLINFNKQVTKFPNVTYSSVRRLLSKHREFPNDEQETRSNCAPIASKKAAPLDEFQFFPSLVTNRRTMFEESQKADAQSARRTLVDVPSETSVESRRNQLLVLASSQPGPTTQNDPSLLQRCGSVAAMRDELEREQESGHTVLCQKCPVCLKKEIVKSVTQEEEDLSHSTISNKECDTGAVGTESTFLPANLESCCEKISAFHVNSTTLCVTVENEEHSNGCHFVPVSKPFRHGVHECVFTVIDGGNDEWGSGFGLSSVTQNKYKCGPRSLSGYGGFTNDRELGCGFWFCRSESGLHEESGCWQSSSENTSKKAFGKALVQGDSVKIRVDLDRKVIQTCLGDSAFVTVESCSRFGDDGIGWVFAVAPRSHGTRFSCEM